jgi:ATP phosphoribosyltransferase regulatory subunit HisZ
MTIRDKLVHDLRVGREDLELLIQHLEQDRDLLTVVNELNTLCDKLRSVSIRLFGISMTALSEALDAEVDRSSS